MPTRRIPNRMTGELPIGAPLSLPTTLNIAEAGNTIRYTEGFWRKIPPYHLLKRTVDAKLFQIRFKIGHKLGTKFPPKIGAFSKHQKKAPESTRKHKKAPYSTKIDQKHKKSTKQTDRFRPEKIQNPNISDPKILQNPTKLPPTKLHSSD